ncbi:hypothetical protein ACWFZ6_18680 [Methylorubrum extorquens]
MADDMKIEIGGKPASDATQKKVREQLAKALQEQLSEEIRTASSSGGVRPAVHGMTGVSS